jgi:hypothetical protein
MKREIVRSKTRRNPNGGTRTKGYNAESVNKAIASSNRAGRRISTKEAKLIHRLLRGRSAKTETTKGNPMAKRRHYTAKQIAAGFGGKRRRSSSSSKRRRTRRNPIRRASAPRRRTRRTRRNPSVASYVSRTRRRLSEGGMTSFFGNTLLPAGVGAIGALALDMAWPYIPLPAALQTGPFAPMVRIVGAVAIGWGVGLVTGKKFSKQAMAGALTVSIYDIAKGYLQNASAAAPPADAGTSAYVDQNVFDLGYYSAAKRAGRLNAYAN